MQELDLEGLFWRPEEPDHKLAGRLRFNPTDGGVLSIIEKKLNLARALGDLVQEVKILFEPLVGNPEKWAREVVRSRASYVVHPGRKGSSDWRRLSLLAESIYVLVVLTLLRDCGVSMESLGKIPNHRHYKWLADKLRASA